MWLSPLPYDLTQAACIQVPSPRSLGPRPHTSSGHCPAPGTQSSPMCTGHHGACAVRPGSPHEHRAARDGPRSRGHPGPLCPRHPRHQLRLLQRGASRNERASRRGPGLRNHLPHEQTAKAPESCPAETPPSVLFLPYSTPVLVGLTGGHQVPCGARCSTWDCRAAKLAPPKGDKRPEPNRTGEARGECSHVCCPSSEHRPIRKGLQGPRHEKSPPCDPQHCL